MTDLVAYAKAMERERDAALRRIESAAESLIDTFGLSLDDAPATLEDIVENARETHEANRAQVRSLDARVAESQRHHDLRDEVDATANKRVAELEARVAELEGEAKGDEAYVDSLRHRADELRGGRDHDALVIADMGRKLTVEREKTARLEAERREAIARANELPGLTAALDAARGERDGALQRADGLTREVERLRGLLAEHDCVEVNGG